MKKIIIQGSITIVLFLGTWFCLTRIDWVNLFEVENNSNKIEEKLGDLIWESIKYSDEENLNPSVDNALDTIVTHICNANEINREKIKIHVIIKDEINAFALPNGHLVVYSGLILNSDVQEELVGVICHEIAHIELDHIMKKLVSEMGLSALISMTTGNGGIDVIKETTKMLSSSAFDRSLEKEADIKAVDYLLMSNVDPEPFANFLYKLSNKEDTKYEYLAWLSSHPDSKERAEYVIEYSQNGIRDFEPILSIETWDKLKIELND